ncbi:MAG: hypothetical protein HN348_02635, partial [Proteobacteria bacterium]|nr:hypothetical protein [Pseudomonadota bacterium]
MRWCLVVALLTACGSQPQTKAPTKPLVRIAGSETITNKLVPALIEDYQRNRDDVRFAIKPGSSGAGITAFLDGEAEIAASTRESTPAEREQAEANQFNLEGARNIIGVDVVGLAVHPSNPLTSLTYDQVIGIFCTRSVDNWAFLGLDDAPIHAFTRDPRSGTRALFEDFFCGPRGIHARVEETSSKAISQALIDDPNAIAYVSLSNTNAKILGLRVENGSQSVVPSQQNIIRGIYPLYHDLYLYGGNNKHAEAFIEWTISPAGQEVVDEARFVPLFFRPKQLDSPRPLRETIHFDMGSSVPNQRSTARLKLLQEELLERAGETRHIILEGFTDSQEEKPMELSRKRAKKVHDLLVDDLPGFFFEIIPRGSVSPLAPNETPFGRQRN